MCTEVRNMEISPIQIPGCCLEAGCRVDGGHDSGSYRPGKYLTWGYGTDPFTRDKIAGRGKEGERWLGASLGDATRVAFPVRSHASLLIACPLETSLSPSPSPQPKKLLSDFLFNHTNLPKPMPGYFIPLSSLFSNKDWDWSACRPIDSDEIIPTSDTNEVEMPV